MHTHMNPALVRWNSLNHEDATREILSCCGSQAWAAALASRRPFADEASLAAFSTEIWFALPEMDWQEAFGSHPRIGQRQAQSYATDKSLQWSVQEQQTALSPDDSTKLMLEEANQRYELKFGWIFIVCASGKTLAEILDILNMRTLNDAASELHETVEQQRQITELRLRRWLESE
jgi:2-oxo-4-hydroxy-4-carboxy-5-ureidoimidazoline decarboxylase